MFIRQIINPSSFNFVNRHCLRKLKKRTKINIQNYVSRKIGLIWTKSPCGCWLEFYDLVPAPDEVTGKPLLTDPWQEMERFQN